MMMSDQPRVREIKILKNKGGFSWCYNPRTTRPFAIIIDGSYVLTKSCCVRTFGSREAAEKWVKKYAESYRAPLNPKVNESV